MTSTPSAFSAETRAVIASVAEGWMRLRAAEICGFSDMKRGFPRQGRNGRLRGRSEEHTSELQSLMRISYAGFCLKKKKKALIRTTRSASTRKAVHQIT